MWLNSVQKCTFYAMPMYKICRNCVSFENCKPTFFSEYVKAAAWSFIPEPFSRKMYLGNVSAACAMQSDSILYSTCNWSITYSKRKQLKKCCQYVHRAFVYGLQYLGVGGDGTWVLAIANLVCTGDCCMGFVDISALNLDFALQRGTFYSSPCLVEWKKALMPLSAGSRVASATGTALPLWCSWCGPSWQQLLDCGCSGVQWDFQELTLPPDISAVASIWYPYLFPSVSS